MKPLTKTQKLIRDKQLVNRMWADPNVFYRVQQNFEAMINLASLLDIVVQDINEDAPFLFHNKAQCFRKLNRSLDECMEWLRTDPMLFGRERNDDKFLDQIKTSNTLLNIFKNILLRTCTDTGLMEVDSVVKLHIANPNIERADKYRIANETLKRHQWEFPAEYLETWRAFERSNAPCETKPQTEKNEAISKTQLEELREKYRKQ